MAIGWMTALKMVPWSDVIENAPTLVNGARKLMSRTKREQPAEETAVTPARPSDDPAERLAQLAHAHEEALARVASLEAEARETATLIKSLAEQQQTMIDAISIMRRRAHALLGVALVLAVACVALAATALLK